MPPVTDAKSGEPVEEQSIATTEQPHPAPALSKVPIRMGVAPQTPEEGWRLAQIFAASDLVPKQYRAKPNDILVAIQYGMEIGFAPLQALSSIAVINGRAAVWGDGFLALLMSSPLYADHDEYYEVDGHRVDGVTVEQMKADTTVAVCTFVRKGKAMPVTRRFSIGQARKSGLLGKEGPWSTYPDRMMAMRARSWAGRDAFPDLLRGIRTAEEALDTPDYGEVIDAPPVQPRRASEAPGGTRAADVDGRSRASADRPVVGAAGGSGGPQGMPERASADLRRAGVLETQTAAAGSDSGNARQPAGGADQPRDTLTTREARGLLVTGTAYVTPKGADPHYEIVMQAGDGERVPFVTRDDRLYKEALSFEGTAFRVIATHHDALKAGTPNLVRVLDALALDETAGSPAPHLFD